MGAGPGRAHRMTIDRRLRYGEAPNATMVAIWLFVVTLLLILQYDAIANRLFFDPDDAARLAQVQALLQGAGWFDMAVRDPNILATGSRLVDLPLYVITALLRPVLGQWAAEQTAIVVIPSLLFLATIFTVGRLAWRILGIETSIFACVSVAMMPVVLTQFLPMRVDYHGYHVLAVVASIWALSWRKPKKGAAVAGAIMGLALMIGLDAVPFAGAFASILLWRWLRNCHARRQLVVYTQALAASCGAAFLLSRGWPSVEAYCNAVSAPHLAFIAVAAIGVTAVARIPRIPPLTLIALVAVVLGAGGAAFAAFAPTCAGGFAGLGSQSAVPLWGLGRNALVASLPQIVLGLGASFVLANRFSGWLHQWWSEYTLLLVWGCAAAVWNSDSLAIAGALSAVPVGWLVAELVSWWSKTHKPAKRVFGAAAISLVLLPALLLVPATYFGEAEGSPIIRLAFLER